MHVFLVYEYLKNYQVTILPFDRNSFYYFYPSLILLNRQTIYTE